MRPILFTIGQTPIPAFFFFLAIASLVATFYTCWLAKKRGLKTSAFLDLGILCTLAAIIGGRVFHILVEYPAYYWEKPSRVFEFWKGGFVSWGGMILFIAVFVLYIRLKKLPFLEYADLMAASSPIVKFFVRVACLLAGCCYGKPTTLPWAITFTNPSSTAYYYHPNIPLHPTQIYSILHATLLFLFINLYYRRKPPAGHTTCWLIIGWTLPRMVIESFRGDTDRGIYFGGLLSTGQITGSLIVLAALGALFFLKSREKKAYVG